MSNTRKKGHRIKHILIHLDIEYESLLAIKQPYPNVPVDYWCINQKSFKWRFSTDDYSNRILNVFILREKLPWFPDMVVLRTYSLENVFLTASIKRL